MAIISRRAPSSARFLRPRLLGLRQRGVAIPGGVSEYAQFEESRNIKNKKDAKRQNEPKKHADRQASRHLADKKVSSQTRVVREPRGMWRAEARRSIVLFHWCESRGDRSWAAPRVRGDALPPNRPPPKRQRVPRTGERSGSMDGSFNCCKGQRGGLTHGVNLTSDAAKTLPPL